MGKPQTKLSWINRGAAEKINCLQLHRQTKDRLMTSAITIKVAASESTPDGMALRGAIISVPCVDRPLSNYCEEPWDDFCVYITYTYDGYSPYDLLTRGEFIVQTLDIWESMYARLEKLNPTVAAEIQVASAYLRSCYLLPELIDMQSTINEIDEIVVPIGGTPIA